ncbi:MAG: hypothetical protein HFJ45_05940 [Clostridia bacterium]|nr:hypothetical protein [Clostridia bacterium]
MLNAIINHFKAVLMNMPALVCQMLVIFVLVFAIVRIVTKNGYRETFTSLWSIVVKYMVMFPVIAVIYLLAPKKVMEVGISLITVLSGGVMVLVIYSELSEFRFKFKGFFLNIDEALFFWNMVLTDRIRKYSLIALTLVLIWGSLWNLLGFLLLVAVGTFLAAQWGVLEKVNWYDNSTQYIITAITVLMLISNIFNLLGVVKVIETVLSVACILVGIVAGLYLLLSKFKGDKSKTDDVYEETYDEEFDDDDR